MDVISGVQITWHNIESQYASLFMDIGMNKYRKKRERTRMEMSKMINSDSNVMLCIAKAFGNHRKKGHNWMDIAHG